MRKLIAVLVLLLSVLLPFKIIAATGSISYDVTGDSLSVSINGCGSVYREIIDRVDTNGYTPGHIIIGQFHHIICLEDFTKQRSRSLQYVADPSIGKLIIRISKPGTLTITGRNLNLGSVPGQNQVSIYFVTDIPDIWCGDTSTWDIEAMILRNND